MELTSLRREQGRMPASELARKEGCGEDVAGNGNKHVKGMIGHQLQNLHHFNRLVF